MPLVKGRSDKAFEHNVKAEMHAGKPQKQSLAIAYAMKRKAQQHKADGGEMCAHGGPEQCNVGCYAEGGSVDSWTKREDNEKGINKAAPGNPGQSQAGAKLHPSFSVSEDLDKEAAKRQHRKTLGEMRVMKKPNLYAEGGILQDAEKLAPLLLAADGADVQDSGPAIDPEKAKQFQKGFNEGDVSFGEAVANAKKALGFAEGGEMKSKRQRAMEAFHKMADGGPVTADDISDEEAAASGYPPGPDRKAYIASKKNQASAQMAEGGEMKSKRQRAMEAFASGGMTETGYEKGVNKGRKLEGGKSYAGSQLRGEVFKGSKEENASDAKETHKKTLSELQSMPKPKLYADGGYIGSYQSKDKPEIDGDLMPAAHLEQELAEHVAHMDAPQSSHEHDVMNQMGDEDEGAGDMDQIHPMIHRIMMGMAKGYSKGGVVANEDQGESASIPDHMAKDKENEFDDLALRNEDMEDADYTGANSGDEDGDAAEDHDRNGIVSRIMRSQAKKNRMAVPGEGSTYGKRK